MHNTRVLEDVQPTSEKTQAPQKTVKLKNNITYAEALQHSQFDAKLIMNIKLTGTDEEKDIYVEQLMTSPTIQDINIE